MPPKTPSFWRDRNAIAASLLPFSGLYLAGHKIKTAFAKPYRSALPVLCIGGVVVGGSGKTPALHAILKLFHDHKLFERPVILTRGYGGTLKGPTLVDPEYHKFEDAGDEALLHAYYAPTIICADRADGARLAEAMDADIILMDDGLQNGTLEKTMSILVAGDMGNGFLLPAGPLREPLSDALKKCACVISTGGGINTDKPIFKSKLQIISEHDKSIPYYAFAGLGNPKKFKKTLEENGFKLNGFESFADHNPYKSADMERLLQRARGAALITTEKDFVRIPESYRDKIHVLAVAMMIENEDGLLNLLKTELKAL